MSTTRDASTGRRRSASPRSSPRSARPSLDDRQLDLRDALSSALLRRINEEVEREDRRAAEDAFDQGTLLNELLEFGFGPDEIAARFAGGPALAHERMRIARSTTRLLAGYWGLARVRLGLALLDRLKLVRLEQLETIDLVTPAGTVHFPATVAELEAALASLP